MAMSTTYPVQLDLTAEPRIARWRPLVQWLLAIPHLAIVVGADALAPPPDAISFVTVLFTKRIPRQVFDTIAMTYRYEWRSASYALFLHDHYPPFDFQPAADDDGRDSAHHGRPSPTPMRCRGGSPSTSGSSPCRTTSCCSRWASPRSSWSCSGSSAVVVTGAIPMRARDFLVGVYRYGLRVQAYVGLLTDQYPPFAVRS